MRSIDIARRLGIDPIVVSVGDKRKVLQPSHLGSLVMKGVLNFCFSDDPDPLPIHLPYIEGIDPPAEGMRRTWVNNDMVRQRLAPMLGKAWADLCDPDGQLSYKHDCQPPGTLVRRVVRLGGHNRHSGEAWATETEDVPIEQIRAGDRVVSWNPSTRLGIIRRIGREVIQAGQRDYSGDLVTITTARGRRSSYTAEHRCIVRLDGDLTDGNFIVYMTRRGDDFRIGRTTWRTRSQGNALGIRRRAEGQKADAIWILSVHETDQEAALAEALTSHEFRIPTWQFQSVNEVMPLATFWSKVGANETHARACLAAHGRDVRFPFWQRGDGWQSTRRPVEMRALNLLNGMQVCEADEIQPHPLGALVAHDGAGGWSAITIRRSFYEGPVYSLDVAEDHTYVADGIVTHNCYLKYWALNDPYVDAEFVLFDEAQDASPVMIGIIAKQTHAQLVWTGDSQQSIYGWRGAVNALQSVPFESRTFLTQSFRFGAAIAEVANVILEKLDAELRLSGLASLDSSIGYVAKPDAILTRTNAVAVRNVLQLLRQQRRVHLVGGGEEIVRFAKAALELQKDGSTWHPELACFTSWQEVLDYVDQDPSGDELALSVKLLDEFGAENIIDGLSGTASEELSDVVVSTAHKAKGREWLTVQLADDFPEPTDDAEEEWRLLYVACTRAQHVLDVGRCDPLRKLMQRHQPDAVPVMSMPS